MPGDDPYDSMFDAAYHWLEARLDFWPLFLAVGRDEWALRMTGYGDQWRRIIGESRAGRISRKPGEFPNCVLFSFTELPSRVVFLDFDWWTCVLNSDLSPLTTHEEKCLFKRSYSVGDWLREARKRPGAVQAVVPELDLRSAAKIWCRNKRSRALLIAMGFSPDTVEVKRIAGKW